MKRRVGVYASFFAFLSAFVLVIAGVAMADPGASNGPGGGGKAGQRPGADEVTEDNDGDGVPNTPDPDGDADNRHPSGKDKHAEAGASGNQGKASSEPDQDGNGPERDEGGTDKPGGSGGADIYDQDGNNGCGNDDDFDDDNEGLCGGPAAGPTVAPTQTPTVSPTTTPTSTLTEEDEVEVAGERTERPEEADVLGVSMARTGSPIRAAAFFGGALIALGISFQLMRRTASQRR